MHRHPPICPPPFPRVVQYGPEPIPLRPEPHVPLTPKSGMRREEIEKKIAEAGVPDEKKAAWDAKYAKPSGGIPKTDLAADVQASLGKADTALQEHQSLAGKADLVGGKVPSEQLPSYVDDVLEYDTKEAPASGQTAFPTTGEAEKIYVAKDTNKTYRWSGTQYVMVGGGDPPVTSVNNKTGDVTLTASDIGAQAVISDLDTIRSGAAAGATAVQPESGKGLFSGSYNDLTNVPQSFTPSSHQHTMSDITDYVPPVQAQADWDESDSDDPSFIQNKPTIPAPVDISGKADSASLAAPYDPTKSPGYAVGDYCTYQGGLYRCTTATADPAGAWTDDANWSSVAVTDEMGADTPLPFDAECEYVTVPAGAWVDPEIVDIGLPNAYDVQFSMRLREWGLFGFGNWRNNQTTDSFYIYSSGVTSFKIAKYWSDSSATPGSVDSWIDISTRVDGYTAGSTTKTYSPSASVKPEAKFLICAFDNKYAGTVNTSEIDIDIAYFRFIGNTYLRSFVPVRVGQVGYLFDRVSGQLFGNAGTGSFVLGPDTFQQGVVPTRMMAMGVRKKKVWPTPLYTGVSLVGSSVQNNNGILSGFTSSSYATMPYYWTSGASQIEAVCKFHSTGANSEEGIWGCVGSANAFTPFYHLAASDKAGLGAFLSRDGRAWHVVPYSGTVAAMFRYQSGPFANPAAGDYILKFVQENGTIRAYAWSGSAWTKHSEVSFGTVYGATNLGTQLGTNRGSNNPFQGTIDLNYTYLYRDGELWWEGVAGAYRNVKTTYPD